MNFSEKLDKFVERGAESIIPVKVKLIQTHGAQLNTTSRALFESGADYLKPIVLKLHEFAMSRRCKTYIGIVTPGREVSVHDGIKCQKCKLLRELTQMLEGGSK